MKTNIAISAFLILAILTGCSSGDKAETSIVGKKADTQLKAMSDILGAADRIKMEVEFSSAEGFPEVMKPGTVLGTLVVERPNRAASLITTEGKQRFFLYEGTQVTMVDLVGKGYAIVPAPSTLDQTLKMLDEEYGYKPILSDFLYSNLYDNFLAGLQGENPELKSVKHAGMEDIQGTQAHHLVFNEEFIDWDLWIAEDTSLPLRIHIVGTSMEGKPMMKIEFLETELNGTIDPEVFNYVPAEGMDKIPVTKPVKD